MKNKKGFTLAELLIVVAILAVLVAVSIPIFTSQLEKSRESVDLSNIRSAYSEVMADAITDGQDHTSNTISLKQEIDDWQNTSGRDSLYSIAASVVGKPAAKGKAWVKYNASASQTIICFEVPVPGDKATEDAKNFAEGTDEHKILTSLAAAERQALELYETENTTKVIGYWVTINPDGTFTLDKKLDSQQFHERKTVTIIGKDIHTTGGYMIAVKDGKVGSNLSYNSYTKQVTSNKYHVRNDAHNNLCEGIDFNY